MSSTNEKVNAELRNARPEVFAAVKSILRYYPNTVFTIATMRSWIDSKLARFNLLPIQPRTRLVYGAMKRLLKAGYVSVEATEGQIQSTVKGFIRVAA